MAELFRAPPSETSRMPSLPLREPPATLCLIRLSAIGDTCHTVPVVRALQSAWPATRLTWIIGKTEHSLLRGLEGVEFVVLDKSRGWPGYLDVRRALGGLRFDVLLHMHASARANLVSLLVAAPLRIGFDRARARDYQWLFTNRRLPARPQRHVMDGLYEFAELLGVEHGAPRWDIPLEPGDRAFVDALDIRAPTLVVSPCTGQRFRNYRNWQIESYAAVADYAHARYGARVLLTGGATEIERRYGEGIVAASRAAQPRNLIGKTTLKQLLGILERASVVLCPDSGPAHMATAVRTPVVGLYATSNRLRTGPYFSQHLVVDKYPEAVRREFGRSVESLRWGERVRNPEAMSLIAVDDVVAKLDAAFAERGIEPKR